MEAMPRFWMSASCRQLFCTMTVFGWPSLLTSGVMIQSSVGYECGKATCVVEPPSEPSSNACKLLRTGSKSSITVHDSKTTAAVVPTNATKFKAVATLPPVGLLSADIGALRPHVVNTVLHAAKAPQTCGYVTCSIANKNTTTAAVAVVCMKNRLRYQGSPDCLTNNTQKPL